MPHTRFTKEFQGDAVQLALTGFVALTWNGYNEPSRTDRSGTKTKELANEADFACRSWLVQDAVSAADHPHYLESSDISVGCCHRLRAARRLDHALERTVICFDAVAIGVMSR